MKKRILWTLLSLLVIVSTLAVACGPKPEPTEAPAEEPTEAPAEAPTEAPPEAEPVTVEVWFHSGKGEERDVLDAQVEDFNSRQYGVIIDAVQLPEGSYNDQVNSAALAGDLPCLLDFDGPFLYNYAWSAYLR
ncbi:MAG: hypothetical protein PVI07_14770, partial [Anaerolineae bacterium]